MRATFFCCITIILAAIPAISHAQSYEMGRTASGQFAYNGPLVEAGIDELVPQLGDITQLIVNSEGGEAKEAVRLAKILNESERPLWISSSCFSSCAAGLALNANDVRVPEGATLLFDPVSVDEAVRSGGRDEIRRCLGAPPAASERRLTHWLSPEVMAKLGLSNIDFEWRLATSSRTSYERYVGRSIVWIDRIDQCPLS